MPKWATVCLAVLALAGAASAATRQAVVTLATVVDATNINGKAFNCDDWFDGSANQQFLDALASFGLPGNLVPAVSCRVSEEVVHSLEMVGAAPGTTLADDPRKIQQGTAELRAVSIKDRISLYINFQYSVHPEVASSQDFFDLLDKAVREGKFMDAVASSPVPLLKAVAQQETYNAGPGLGPGVAC